MKKFRKNNKGFTLVELIIVIAVIAILSAVAAPQYIKYVEKSRVAKDENNAGSIRTAIETIIVDNNSDSIADNNIPATFTVTFCASGIVAADTAAAEGVTAVDLGSLRTGLEEILGGTFDASTKVNPILQTSQTTKPTCAISFENGKFKAMAWS